LAAQSKLKIMRVCSLPDSVDRRLFMESQMGSQFMLYHDLLGEKTFLIKEGAEGLQAIRNALPGIEFEEADERIRLPAKTLCLVTFAMPQEDRDALRGYRGEFERQEGVLDVAYRLLGGQSSFILASFVPVDREALLKIKERVEEAVSKKEIRLTKSLSTRETAYSETDAKQMDLYYESDERKALMAMLNAINNAVLANGASYRITLLIDPEDRQAYAYLKSKLLITEEFEIRENDLERIFSRLGSTEAIPVDNSNAALMLGFSNRVRVKKAIETSLGARDGNVSLGKYLECSARETDRDVKISSETLNLGTLITGVPGTGKTFAAMTLIAASKRLHAQKIVVVSPTEEWNAFGYENGAYVIKLYDSRVPINFFRCYAGINPERFYENLAMLLASASDAGPYRDSLEKCLLAAFHKVYKRISAPDPLEVYEAIEEAIVEQHATKTNVGVKYTKHGENVKASLENLRLMLNLPEFAFSKGADFGELLSKGVVFDLSRVSNKMKPFFYALILNQAYSFADSFDISGNDALRLLICLEEAQLIFRKEEKSAATADLKQRIQDFRKRGVGLMIIAHNAMDIEPGVRRLCQTKLYFRQSSDSSKYAADDLLFEEKDKEAVVDRLKTLEHRVCALNCIERSSDGKNAVGSIFVKIASQVKGNAAEADLVKGIERKRHAKKSKKIKFVGTDGEAKAGLFVEAFYAGEKIFRGKTGSDGCIVLEKVIIGKNHKIIVHGEKKRDARIFTVVTGKDDIVKL
jgi:hypothetical protein